MEDFVMNYIGMKYYDHKINLWCVTIGLGNDGYFNELVLDSDKIFEYDLMRDNDYIKGFKEGVYILWEK